MLVIFSITPYNDEDISSHKGKVTNMSRNEKIIRVRPYNMANFSGGSGYMPMMVLFGAFISLPATLVLWLGLASPMQTDVGPMDYKILKRRLNRIALPICLVLFALLAWVCVINVYGNIWAFMPESIWGAAFPTLGIYFAMLLSAKVLVGNNLSKGKWLLIALAFMAAIAIVGFTIMVFVLEPLCYALDDLI